MDENILICVFNKKEKKLSMLEGLEEALEILQKNELGSFVLVFKAGQNVTLHGDSLMKLVQSSTEIELACKLEDE